MRKAAKEANLTLREISDLTGITEESISKYSQGRVNHPRGSNMAKLADALDVPVNWLVFGEGQATSNYANPDKEGLRGIPLLDFADEILSNSLLSSSSFNSLEVDVSYLKSLKLENSKLVAKIIETDTMHATLMVNDKVLIDLNQCIPEYSGIYLIRSNGKVSINRIEIIVGSVAVKYNVVSDNHLYSNYEIEAGDIEVMGRVVWFGRRI